MFNILLVILKKRKYALIALISAIIMVGFFYYLTVINVYHKSILIYAEMNGSWFTIITVILGVLIAILFGSYIALLVFRREVVKARALANKTTGFSGAALGAIASGCPSCGVPILGLIGLPLGLFSLPLKGIELKIISIGFLFLSIYLISKNIKKNLVCQPSSLAGANKA